MILDSSAPIVSIGIATYKRPEMLKRALNSIAAQNFKNVEVIISNNDGNDHLEKKIISSFADILPSIRYYKQSTNIGSAKNFLFLLEMAKGKYYMWLADDDEISDESYIKELLYLLEGNENAMTAFANWMLVRENGERNIQKAQEYSNPYWYLRAAKFISKPNDNILYGLHRVEAIRQAKIIDYFAPNKGVASNAAYPYVFDVVLRGEILQVKNHQINWVNHADTHKHHSSKFVGWDLKLIIKYILLRMNVHCLYLYKIYIYKGLVGVFFMVPISLSMVIKEFFGVVIRKIFKNN